MLWLIAGLVFLTIISIGLLRLLYKLQKFYHSPEWIKEIQVEGFIIFGKTTNDQNDRRAVMNYLEKNSPIRFEYMRSLFLFKFGEAYLTTNEYKELLESVKKH
jgi:hypothetical protein